jgi:hypothetical protein
MTSWTSPASPRSVEDRSIQAGSGRGRATGAGSSRLVPAPFDGSKSETIPWLWATAFA